MTASPKIFRRPMTVVVLFVALAAMPKPVFSQVSHEEHAHHHANPSEGSGASPKHGHMGGMMHEMMQDMGGPTPKEIYPRLMDLPDLTAEERAEIEREAHQRMLGGVKLLSDGLDELSSAAPNDDFSAMQAATAKMREGLTQFETGLAAHRAIREGKAANDVALQWFKREMNLLPPEGAEQSGILLWGMSPLHAAVMVLLVLFFFASTVMYFFRMRRASVLLEKLAAAEPTIGAGVTMVSPASLTESPPESNGIAIGQPAQDAGFGCCDVPSGVCPTEAETDGASEISTGLLPIRKRKLCRLRVARIDRETPDVKTFRFISCHGGGIPFSYLPGQFLTLTLSVGENPIHRSYTISSSPTQGYYCEISVKREEHGEGSRFLHDQVNVGDTFEVQAPNGRFYFTGKEADSIVLIAGGVGITPMMSITRALTDMAWEGEIYFIVACHDPEHFIFEPELNRLTAKHPNLRLFAAMSRIERDMDAYRSGRLTRKLLAKWVPEITSKRIHLCGPPAMMDAVKKMLAELSVPAENIHIENFGGEQKPRVRAEQRVKVAELDAAETLGTATYDTSRKSTRLQPDETILEASERIGVAIDYSCRVGMCGVCAVKLLSGKVSMEVEEGLEPEQKQADMILTCQAKATGDVSVEA